MAGHPIGPLVGGAVGAGHGVRVPMNGRVETADRRYTLCRSTSAEVCYLSTHSTCCVDAPAPAGGGPQYTHESPMHPTIRVCLVALVLSACSQLNTAAPYDAAGTGTAGMSPGGLGGQGGTTPASVDSGPQPVALDAPVSNTVVCNDGSIGISRCTIDGGAVEVCASNGQWNRMETCTATCSGGRCTGTCSPGSRHCGLKQTPETCNSTGEWVADPTCEFACTGQGQCGGECKPGAKRCDGVVPQTCDETGRWIREAPCTNLCSSGSCGGTCLPGKRRCGANQSPEMCSEKGTWEPAPTPCPFLCSGDGQCTGECIPGAKQCATTTPQTCEAGRWTNSGPPCPFVCSQGACGGICSPGTKRCGSNAVQICASDGSGWADSASCQFGCDPQTMGCRACSLKQGQSCFNSDCQTGTFDCQESCQRKNKANGTACGQPASCRDRNSSRAADSCQNGQCQPGDQCDYHGCGSNGKCTKTCPSDTNDTGNACEPCGKADQRCCAKNTCSGNAVCFVSSVGDPICVNCGGIKQFCCGPRRDQCSSGECQANPADPNDPGHCLECGSEFQSCCKKSSPACRTGFVCGQFDTCELGPSP
jgi:hypothetical protein